MDWGWDLLQFFIVRLSHYIQMQTCDAQDFLRSEQGFQKAVGFLMIKESVSYNVLAVSYDQVFLVWNLGCQ